MSSYKVKIYVLDKPKDSANGKVFNLPIIPRVGDYIDVKYKTDPVNHPLISHAAVFEVKRVHIHEVGSAFDAILHVDGDDEF